MNSFDVARLKKHKTSVTVVLVAITCVVLFGGSFWTIVSAGNTGVQSRFGKVYDEELSSGFHIKNPLVRVVEMTVRTVDYTMSVTQGEGERVGPDAITALTKEGLNVDIDITVLYHLQEDKASDIYRDVGLQYDEVVLRPQIRSTIREIVALYSAKDIYSEKRSEASAQILAELKKKIDPRGIEVEDVLLRNVVLPDNLANSIEAKLQAEQDAERYEFLLQTEQKEAERKRVEAEGQRDAQQIINQSLTTRYLEYLYIESLKDRAGTIYVPTNPSNGTPLFRGL
jgi:regulator of protease activity HflC (stomatin/prohibitin superfamily)